MKIEKQNKKKIHKIIARAMTIAVVSLRGNYSPFRRRCDHIRMKASESPLHLLVGKGCVSFAKSNLISSHTENTSRERKPGKAKSKGKEERGYPIL
jgi:hypothetical protein